MKDERKEEGREDYLLGSSFLGVAECFVSEWDRLPCGTLVVRDDGAHGISFSRIIGEFRRVDHLCGQIDGTHGKDAIEVVDVQVIGIEMTAQRLREDGPVGAGDVQHTVSRVYRDRYIQYTHMDPIYGPDPPIEHYSIRICSYLDSSYLARENGHKGCEKRPLNDLPLAGIHN